MMLDSNKNNDTKSVIKNVALISQDAELVRMAKGAISGSQHQQLVVFDQPVSQIGGQIRDAMLDMIIVDMDVTSMEDLEHLQKIKRMIGNATPLVIVSHDFSQAAARILIQLKVTDFLVKPLATSDFVRACNNALKTSGEAAQVEPQFLSFIPAAGGVGNTTLALETAAILNRNGKTTGRSTCVVDLNFQHGCCAEYLDIEPRFNIEEIENAPERLDKQLLEMMLSQHESGLSVVSAPNQPSEMRSFKAPLVVRLLDLVSAYFDYVVIDLPRIWFPWTETVLLGSNKLFVVADMTVPAIRHANGLLDAIFEKIGAGANARILVNRVDTRKSVTGLDFGDLEKALGSKMVGGIPNNYQLVRAAVDRGAPLAAIEKNSDVTQALEKIILSNDESSLDDAQDKNAVRSGLSKFGLPLLGRKNTERRSA